MRKTIFRCPRKLQVEFDHQPREAGLHSVIKLSYVVGGSEIKHVEGFLAAFYFPSWLLRREGTCSFNVNGLAARVSMVLPVRG